MSDDLLRRQLAEIFAADQSREKTPERGKRPEPSRLRMVAVRPLGDDLIESFLKAQGFRRLRDEDGEFIVRFAGQDHRLGGIDIGIAIDGEDGTILELRASFDARFEPSRFAAALILCNDWNRQFRNPKAVLLIRDDVAMIVLRQCLVYESGTFEQQVHEVLDFFFAMASQFHDWALEQGSSVF